MKSETSYKRICPSCNKELIYKSKYRFLEACRKSSSCLPCVRTALNKSQPKKLENNPCWKGYKGVPYKWFSKYFERANRKKAGSITIEDAYNKLEEQGFKCALTGIDLPWSDKSGMSIDRIDSSIGYEIDNIQIVHKDVNVMKNHFDQNYFIEVCRRVVEYRSVP